MEDHGKAEQAVKRAHEREREYRAVVHKTRTVAVEMQVVATCAAEAKRIAIANATAAPSRYDWTEIEGRYVARLK